MRIAYFFCPLLTLLSFLQNQGVVDAGRQLAVVVAHHNERFGGVAAVVINDVLHFYSVGIIETVEGFVKNQQLWVLDKGSCEQSQSLLAAGEL